MITEEEQRNLHRWKIMLDCFPYQHGTFIQEMKEMHAELAACLAARSQLADVLRFHGLPFSLPEPDDVID